MLNGLRMTIVAEDGKPYGYSRDQASAMLAAGKTRDAIISPAQAGEYAVYDRMLDLTNNAAAPGGLLSYLSVGGVVSPPPPSCLTGYRISLLPATARCPPRSPGSARSS